MKKILMLFLTAGVQYLLLNTESFAGNGDRAGQAGAPELLINPWARSSGWNGANSASVRGIEGMFLNVAGTAFTKKSEFVFSTTNLIKAADIKINTFGFTQKMGESSVIGLGIMAMNFGAIPVTTVDLPEGGTGTFSPQYLNIGLSYAKAFSNSIYGGINVKAISESIANIGAQGIAFDAGIQYVTGIGQDKDGKRNSDNLKFGIALKNVGPPIRYRGDGLSFSGTINSTGSSLSVEQRSERFELPSLVNIGGTYDYKISDMHRLSFAANFTSNSFTNNQYQGGIEYGFRSYFMVRAGYLYEKDIANSQLRTIWFTGPSGGFTFEVPIGKLSDRTFGLDYSYRASSPFAGVHSIGARINL